MTLDLEDAKTLLRRTPSVLDSLLRGLPEAWLRENEGPDTWSSFDVVGHLLEAEETNWIPRIRHLITHGESSAFPPFDRFGFAEKVKGKSTTELLDALADARGRSLRALDELRLAPADLGRRGRHPDSGGAGRPGGHDRHDQEDTVPPQPSTASRKRWRRRRRGTTAIPTSR